MQNNLRAFLLAQGDLVPLSNLAGRDRRVSWSMELKRLESRRTQGEYRVTGVRYGIIGAHPDVARFIANFAQTAGDNFARILFGFAGPPRVGGSASWPRVMTREAFEREEELNHWSTRPVVQRMSWDQYKEWVGQWPRVPLVGGVFWLPGAQQYHSGLYQAIPNGFATYMNHLPQAFNQAGWVDATHTMEWWARHLRIKVADVRTERANAVRITYELWGLKRTLRDAFLTHTQDAAFSYKSLFNLPAEPIVKPNQRARYLYRIDDVVPEYQGGLYSQWGSYEVWYAQWAPHMTDVYVAPFAGARSSPVTLQGRFWLPGHEGLYGPGLEVTMYRAFAHYMMEHVTELFGEGHEDEAPRLSWHQYLDMRMDGDTAVGDLLRPVQKVTYTLKLLTLDQIFRLREHLISAGDTPRGVRLQQMFGLPKEPRVASNDFPHVVPEGRSLVDIDDRRLVVETDEEYMAWYDDWREDASAQIRANAPTPAPQAPEWPGLGNGGPGPIFPSLSEDNRHLWDGSGPYGPQGGGLNAEDPEDVPMPAFRPLPADESDAQPVFRPLPADESDGEPVFRNAVVMDDDPPPTFRNMVVFDHEDDEPQYQAMSADADGIPPPPSYANGDPVPQHLRRDVYRDRGRQE